MTTPLKTALGKVDRDRAAEFARRITAIEIVNDLEGPRAEVMADLLEHPRLDVHVDPALPGRPNVIVRLKGTGTGPALLINGHIDGRYYAHGWSHDPLDPWIADNRMYGGVISDMLGGVASMMETMRAAADIEPLPGDLVFLGNMWHDSNGLGTKYALASDEEWPKFGINGEPTSMSILTAHGGCIKFEVKFRGRTAHVSRQSEGVDALAAAVAVYSELKKLDFMTFTPHPELETLPRMEIGVLRGGFAGAAVADEAVFQGDVRIVPGMRWQTFRDDIQRVIDRLVTSGVTTRIGCLVRQHPFIGPKSGPTLDAVRAGHRAVFGRDPDVNIDKAAQCFVTDTTDMWRAGIDSVVYGPAAWHYAPDEYIDLDEMADAARVYLAAAYHLMGVAD